MIILAVLTVLFGLCDLAVSFLPTGSPPSFLASIAPIAHDVVAGAAGLGGWIPWDIAAGTTAAVFSLWLVLTAVSALRWILGWVPTMGGS